MTKQAQTQTRLESLQAELAARKAQLAKKREKLDEVARKIKALTHPKLTRKQDAAVKIARGVAVVEWLRRRADPDLQAEYEAVLAETTKNNSVRELLGLAPLPKAARHKADQDTQDATTPDYPHPPGSKREGGGVWLGLPKSEKEDAKEAAQNAGGRITWDRVVRQWYTEDEDLSPYTKWLPPEEGGRE